VENEEIESVLFRVPGDGNSSLRGAPYPPLDELADRKAMDSHTVADLSRLTETNDCAHSDAFIADEDREGRVHGVRVKA
jgi:hypothetical protein